jgi:hypothetical protein
MTLYSLTFDGTVEKTGVVGGDDLPVSDFKFIGIVFVPCNTRAHDVRVPEIIDKLFP